MPPKPKPTPKSKVQPRDNENGGHHKNGGIAPLLDHVKFELICERYAETGLARASCEELGFNYNTVNGAIQSRTSKGDMSWRDLWDESYEKFKESLEREIVKRGRDGKPRKWLTDKEGKPVLDPDGKMIVTEVEYSDRMLELAAKGHFPERYRDKIYASGAIGLEPADVFTNLTSKAVRAIRQIIMQDLEEQRQATLIQETEIIDADYTEMLEDLREGGDSEGEAD